MTLVFFVLQNYSGNHSFINYSVEYLSWKDIYSVFTVFELTFHFKKMLNNVMTTVMLKKSSFVSFSYLSWYTRGTSILSPYNFF